MRKELDHHVGEVMGIKKKSGLLGYGSLCSAGLVASLGEHGGVFCVVSSCSLELAKPGVL